MLKVLSIAACLCWLLGSSDISAQRLRLAWPSSAYDDPVDACTLDVVLEPISK